jgi:hypothetical protein
MSSHTEKVRRLSRKLLENVNWLFANESEFIKPVYGAGVSATPPWCNRSRADYKGRYNTLCRPMEGAES